MNKPIHTKIFTKASTLAKFHYQPTPISSATLDMIDESIANDTKGIRGRKFDINKFKKLFEEN